MNKLTGIKDLDQEILKKVDDRVKLLVEKGTEIREHYINIAIQKGYTEIAEYLRSKID